MTSAKTWVRHVGTAMPGVIPALLLTHILSLPVLAQSVPVLRGDADCAWGSADCNRCVPDVAAATERLRSHGDILGFHMNGAADVDPPDAHWQGIQRLTGGSGRYLAVSRSVTDLSVASTAVVIVEMASRNSAGARFRSNRLAPDWQVPHTPPPSSDRVVGSIPLEAGHIHAGGMQAVGDVLAVPMEGGTPGSRVVFYDVSDPLHPTRLPRFVDHSSLASAAGTASLAKLATGRFLLIIGQSDASPLDFYVSTTTTLRETDFEYVATWNKSDLLPAGAAYGDYQSLNLVTQCDGVLYLIGTHNSGSYLFPDEDFADVFRVESGAGNDVQITKVAAKHLVCGYNDVNHCNLDAAGGVYVDPTGQIYIYGTEHDNDGPLTGGVPCINGSLCSVKFEEFRPVPHGTCDTIAGAWVELYDDAQFGGPGLMIDYVDRHLENYANYDQAEAFEDRASSVRWCLPVGASYRLWVNKEPCRAPSVDLTGTGSVEAIADLANVGFGDSVSCSQWLGGPFADAGPDVTLECAGPRTTLTLDGRASSDVDDRPLTFQWSAGSVPFDDATSATPTGQFPLGATPVTLVVSADGAQATDTAVITVVDTAPPTISAPPAVTVECTSAGGTSPALGTPVTTDVCDPSLTISNDAPAGFPLGATTVTWTARDDSGNAASAPQTVSVVDTRGPELTVSLSPAVLGPPDHRLVRVAAQITVADACDLAPQVWLISIVSNEAPDTVADGRSEPDIQGAALGTDDREFMLRAERRGDGSGRVYTVTYAAQDASGNVTTRPATVTVPHSASGHRE